MEWTNEKTNSFIEDYHNSPELWNNKIAEYEDIKIKNDTLKQLSRKYNCSVTEVKKKIKNLRTAFYRERKTLQQKNSGSSSKKGKWFAFELLSFLLDVDVPKSTSSTAGSDEEDLEIEHGEDAQNVNDVPYSPSQSPVPSPSYSSASGTSRKVFKSPMKKMIKRKRADEAYAILRNAMNERDASTVFGDYVATKHRKYSGYTKNVIEHLINTVLYDADMGKYDDPQHQRDEYERNTSSAIQSEASLSSQVDHRGRNLTAYYRSFSDDSYSSND